MNLRPFLASVISSLSACLAFAIPSTLSELNPREGLPFFFAKAHAGNDAELRIAFLGGSITAAKGWRIGTLDVLRKQFPHTRFTEIHAAIPGTGSDFGSARLHENVLVHGPDLLFVEFAVNDLGKPALQIEQTMEGIVRQARLALPDLDIWFVYTLSSAGLPDIKAGRYPPSARAMENVANHYGIPSLQFGVEILRRLENGSIVFRGASNDPKSFTNDNVHPTSFGHQIYTDTIERSIRDLASSAKTPASALRTIPPALHPDNWEKVRLVPVNKILKDSSFSLSDIKQILDEDHRFSAIPKELRRPTVQLATPNKPIQFEFSGSTFGIISLKGPDAGCFTVRIDDSPPVESTFFDAYCGPRRYRIRPWFYPKPLASGPHTVTIELISKAPDKNRILKHSPTAKPLEEMDADYSRNILTITDFVMNDTSVD